MNCHCLKKRMNMSSIFFVLGTFVRSCCPKATQPSETQSYGGSSCRGGRPLPAAAANTHVLPSWPAARSDREAIDCPLSSPACFARCPPQDRLDREAVNFPLQSRCPFFRLSRPQDRKAVTSWLHLGLEMYRVQAWCMFKSAWFPCLVLPTSWS